MHLDLDHFFILVEPGGTKLAEHLLSLGLKEGPSNKHQGQGTANRRFYFADGRMLELLWVHDALEAANGPARGLYFPERAGDPTASPFGIILHRKDHSSQATPFAGWSYQPAYFEPPRAFHIGANSDNLCEPLCIYVPFCEPVTRGQKSGAFKSLSEVRITTPSRPLSEVLATAATADGLAIEQGEQHLAEISFDGRQAGRSYDLRPDFPLVMYW